MYVCTTRPIRTMVVLPVALLPAILGSSTYCSSVYTIQYRGMYCTLYQGIDGAVPCVCVYVLRYRTACDS
jgi:hypothetical protein